MKSQQRKKMEKSSKPEYLAIIKLRRAINADAKAKGVLNRLRMRKKLTMAVFKNTPEILAQMTVVKDYTTYGEIDAALFEEIMKKRGKEYKGPVQDSKKKIKYTFITYQGKNYNPYFALHPPIGGFERGGIKKSFQLHGALGYRGEKIKELIARML